ncbi:MAG TPA: hypothetical protein VMR34_02935 [Candidatus Saccharimonadales bacterium]|nr:hypothetical protein [Candidatus Saccharimonadales bacterium]
MQNIKKTYNGWTNRETWLVSLWLNNDPVSYSMFTEALELEASDREKAEWLETNIKDEMFDLPLEASLWSDLLGTSLTRVNWVEVIENN